MEAIMEETTFICRPFVTCDAYLGANYDLQSRKVANGEKEIVRKDHDNSPGAGRQLHNLQAAIAVLQHHIVLTRTRPGPGIVVIVLVVLSLAARLLVLLGA